MKRTVVFVVFAMLLSVGCIGDTGEYTKELPPLKAHMNDYAELFEQETRDSVEAWLTRHEAATTNQIVVLTVPSIGDRSIEEYSIWVADAWKLGQKDRDNGVLITVAEEEKEVRIEVGYGLEGALTDLQAGYIIRHFFLSHVSGKSKDFDAAIQETVTAIMRTIAGEFTAIEAEVDHESKMTWCLIILGIAAFVAGLFGTAVESSAWSGSVGAVAYPIIWSLFWGVDGLFVILAVIVGFVVCFVARYAVEILGESSSGSSGFSFGGGGGGGWSGGGGGFGGGGASGGW